MFFKPKFRTNSYHRRGFRLRGNTLVLLFFFFLVGLFLHYGGKTKPVVAFWNDVKQIIGLGPSKKSKQGHNPYKAPEPDEDVASDDRSSASDNAAPDAKTEDNAPNNPEATRKAGKSESGNNRFAFEKEVDFALPGFKASDEIVRHEGYTLRFKDQYKQADWVAYPLLAYEITGDADRSHEQFMPDPAVSSGSAVPADYSKSGYDRGHLAPAGDFKFSQRMMRESFYMSNMSPQAPQFNRGIWKSLEEQVRSWAFRDKGVYVVTGPVLTPGLPTIGKQNEVAVPAYYYKVLLYCNAPDIRMIAFLLKNEGSDEQLQSFVVTVDEVERRTGINFFPKIPDDLQKKLESAPPKKTVAEWFY
nr:DNA/RNA non-specific endonuclease [uncultured Arsenicibacter sp.]